MCDIVEISPENASKEGAVQLLLQAIRTLPRADQDVVLALLLQGLTDSDAWQAAVRSSDEVRRFRVASLGTMEVQFGGLIGDRPTLLGVADAKVVPIRFPPKLHEQLKAWCEEHNFPMAAVVRGLVERFLESQGLP